MQLKLDAEFPRFTQALLEIVYPHYLAPTPSMLVAQLHAGPERARTSPRGSTIPRGTHDASALLGRRCHGLRVPDGAGRDALAGRDRVGELFLVRPRPAAQRAAASRRRIKGGVRIRLKTTAGLKFAQTALDRLCFYLTGRDDVANKLYELCLGDAVGVLVLPGERGRPARVPAAGAACGRWALTTTRRCCR